MPTLDWIGKQAVVNHDKEVPYRLLHCDKKLSAGDPESGNLIVQGDNLNALKALLPYYAGKVKCIYIDPPYNTGNEQWVYNDNVNAPEIKAWLGQTVDRDDLSKHDKWLCLMYPRLKLLQEFLSEDGVICVSIDDDEAGHLRLLLSELFSSVNFIANVVWQKRYVANVTAKYLSDMHDHIMVFARNAEYLKVHLVPRTEEQKKDYKNHDEDPRGPWRAQDLSASKPYKAGQFTITGPDGNTFNPPPNRYWRMNREQYDKWLSEGRITFGKTGKGRPMLKRFLSDVQQGLTPDTWWSHDFAGHNKEATLEVKQLFDGAAPFDTPKPVKLIKRVLQIFTDSNSLILDSFAGSGTTMHAVMQLNREDGGNRRCIMVEMEEKIATEVTSERIRRVMKQEGARENEGFRYCELGDELFAADGTIRGKVKYKDLAHHIFFTETGRPLPPGSRPKSGKTPLLGEDNGRTIYLLFNGVMGDKSVGGGNILTRKTLEACGGEAFEDGPRTIYGEGCRLSDATLRRLDVHSSNCRTT